MNITIDKGVPMPSPSSPWKDILGKMEIGDSILTDKPKSLLRYRKSGYQFTQKKEGDKVRVWLTAKNA